MTAHATRLETIITAAGVPGVRLRCEGCALDETFVDPAMAVRAASWHPLTQPVAEAVLQMRDVATAVKAADWQREPRHRVSLLHNDWTRITAAVAALEAAGDEVLTALRDVGEAR